MEAKSSKFSLWILISVFFFWGFVAASNTILIPIFKSNFDLTQWQSQLVDFAFYIAYFIGSLVYFLISLAGGDPLNKIGYKKGLILGLCISAIGALGFVPAAGMGSFYLMLFSLFTVALGFALQQIVANPYVIALGNPETGAHRVSLAGGINSFGTTIGPLVVAYAIFGNIDGKPQSEIGMDAVQAPYIALFAAFLIFALILGLSKLPAIKTEENLEKNIGALKFPQIIWGMLAIFVYVGTEVTIQSNLPELMKQENILGLEAENTVHFISLYWGGLMIGRWVGAIKVFELKPVFDKAMKFLIPFLAFVVILAVNYIKGSPVNDLVNFLPYILILIAGFFLSNDKPALTMILFGSIAALMMLVGLLTEGKLALYAFISGGLFCSVMWPCIFSLSIAGLGKYTNQGSSLLIMMILGGAILPPIQGFLADKIGIQPSYFIPFLGFAFLAFYGFKVKSILKNQGIDYDANVSAGH